MSAEPSGPLPTAFDLVGRLRAAAMDIDDLPAADVEALLREAAVVIEALRAEARDRGLATAEPAGNA